MTTESGDLPNDSTTHQTLIHASATIVAGMLQSKQISAFELKATLRDVYSELAELEAETRPTANSRSGLRQAPVSIEDSVQPDYIVCLEDGKQLKMLKRYLKTNYNMTPEEYRKRWNLPATYPMVAPEYAKRRSELAKEIGLGKDAPRVNRMKTSPVARKQRELAVEA